MKTIWCLLLALQSGNVTADGFKFPFPVMSNLQALHQDFIIGTMKDKDTSLVKEINMDIIADDGVKLKATYYTLDKPGPGMLLLHQCNMDRKSWKPLAMALASLGVHVLTFDYRGYGETPRTGGYENLTKDIDAAFQLLLSQPKVDRLRIGAGGASCGVNNSVELARRSGKINVLMLLSGPASKEGLLFLKEHPDLAIFGAASSEEDFAVKAIKEMVSTSKNPLSKMTVLQNAGHGVPMFSADPGLLQSVTQWIIQALE